MTERVFLSEKKVILSTSLQGNTCDEVVANLTGLLEQPFVVKDRKGEREEKAEAGCSVTSYGAMLLEDGTQAFVLSISALGTSICGMYLFREGDNRLCEMVDPDRRRVSEVIKGEHL